jgi:hypothetical protein
MTIQDQHKAAYCRFTGDLRQWLGSQRGRASRLARHLGVNRQNVHRWFVSRSGDIDSAPAWAAMTANVWYHQQLKAENALFVSPQADKAAKNQVVEYWVCKSCHRPWPIKAGGEKVECCCGGHSFSIVPVEWLEQGRAA